MTTNHIKALHTAKPFRAFRIHIADGTSVDVTHPELMLLSQGAAPYSSIRQART